MRSRRQPQMGTKWSHIELELSKLHICVYVRQLQVISDPTVWAELLFYRLDHAHLLIGCGSRGAPGRFPSEPHPSPAGPNGTACGFDLWLPRGVSFYHLCGFGTKSITVMRYWPSKKDYCRFKSNQSDCGLPARGKRGLNMVKIR